MNVGTSRPMPSAEEAENGSAKLTVYNTRANMTREVGVLKVASDTSRCLCFYLHEDLF